MVMGFDFSGGMTTACFGGLGDFAVELGEAVWAAAAMQKQSSQANGTDCFAILKRSRSR
jgi:hypothetical protein